MIYNWYINEMEVSPSLDGLTNVVKKINFTYEAVDGEYRTWIRDNYFCPNPSSTDFTAYDNLTKEQVIGWLESGLDLVDLQKQLQDKIDMLKISLVSLPLPFEN
jgi:hypothetical protein